MPTALLFQIADLAFDPNFADIDLDHIFDASEQLRDRKCFGGGHSAIMRIY
jgi:hypothetical protein